jgi:hypothetical protein
MGGNTMGGNTMGGNMTRLENWSIGSNQNGFTAPEIVKLFLRGSVYGHPKFNDGERVHTSQIVSVHARIVTTKTGSSYKLGKIDKGYRKWLKANVPDWDYRKPIKSS